MHERDFLVDMIRTGGVYYNVSGANPEEIFEDAVKHILLPPGVDRGSVLLGLCEREKLMTTAIGHGIAVPHPRTPLVSRDEDERLYVCFLDKPVNFGAMDGKPVHTLFVILSSGSSSHLRILSRLSWLLQQEGFRDTLRKKPDTEELVSVLKYYSQGVSHHEQRT
jgi:PTS system nitrogen regulatory IIA component